MWTRETLRLKIYPYEAWAGHAVKLNRSMKKRLKIAGFAPNHETRSMANWHQILTELL